jgi:hypothetical protein
VQRGSTAECVADAIKLIHETEPIQEIGNFYLEIERSSMPRRSWL